MCNATMAKNLSDRIDRDLFNSQSGDIKDTLQQSKDNTGQGIKSLGRNEGRGQGVQSDTALSELTKKRKGVFSNSNFTGANAVFGSGNTANPFSKILKSTRG